ncbi:PREDICTED: uncharacterized protein LOC109226446 isoform X1 [Nicotiana attenuata]|uniref:Uncharacterized protein n=1 Tax=Nicotiana attenuata TaxID=49451 RepID=A0A1J6IUT8_NICAT|nr:PREDICTED: uncharacterized protein LOC109226446 isoform X1 [Nicotiana attenuata]OIT08044.1 hypothetical protein A4A49_11848 [Nicotiana attenuata]
MATFTSFAIRIPNLQSSDRRSIFQPNGSQKIHKLLRCNAENSTSNSSNSTSTSSQDSEPDNLLLKMAWYGSEFLGIAASFFRSPTDAEVSSEGNLELEIDESGLVDRALVADTIKADFQRSYFVTGNLTLNAYEENCEFADPAGSFKGLSRFKRNCTNFGYLVQRSNMKLMKWEDFEEKAIGHWRFSCVLSFPWKPILSATGYTEYYFNEKSGKVCRHIEHWNVPKMALLKQIIRPSKGIWQKKASG